MDTKCPICGEDGVRACVDSDGNPLMYDHDGRPPYFQPWVDALGRSARGGH